MPSRYIRDGWLDSDRVRKCGEPAEVLLLRLALEVDDYGRGDRRLTVIKSRCWPVGEEDDGLPPGPALEEIAARLQALVEAELVVPYEARGKPYFYIPNFRQRTRSASRFPDPPPVDGQPADTPPTTARAVTDKAPQPARQPAAQWRHADGGPQARSRSSTRSVTPAVGQAADKPRTFTPAGPAPFSELLAKAQAKGEVPTPPATPKLDEPDQAIDNPEAGGIVQRALNPVEDTEGNTDLDTQGSAYGMQRLPFEDDSAYTARINARKALG